MDEPAQRGIHAGELSLQDYLSILRRRRLLAIGVLIATIALAALYSFVAPRTYQATSSVLLRTSTNQQLFPSVPATQAADFNRTATAEFEFVDSTSFSRAASAVSPASATVNPEFDDNPRLVSRSSLLDFVAQAPTPLAAQQAADAWAATYLELREATARQRIEVLLLEAESQINELEMQKDEVLVPLEPIERALLAETDSDSISRLTTQRLSLMQSLSDELQPIDFQLRELNLNVARLRIGNGLAQDSNMSAMLSKEAGLGQQIAPNVPRNMALALVLGTLLAAGVAMLAESLTSSIRSAEDLERLAPSLTVLATLPDLPKGSGSPGHHAMQNGTPYAEALERLVSALLYQRVGRPGNRLRVLVTSALPGEGKSTVTSNVGRRLSHTNTQAVLIDADLRRPTMHKALGIQRTTGLNELLHRGDALAPHLVALPDAPNVRFLPAGPPTDDAASLLRQSFSFALDEMPLDYDLLMIDAPPVLAVTDAEIIAEAVDMVVLVVRAGNTKASQIRQALSRLASLEASIAGFVLLGAKNDSTDGYSYSYNSVEDGGDEAAPERPTRVAPRAQASRDAAVLSPPQPTPANTTPANTTSTKTAPTQTRQPKTAPVKPERQPKTAPVKPERRPSSANGAAEPSTSKGNAQKRRPQERQARKPGPDRTRPIKADPTKSRSSRQPISEPADSIVRSWSSENPSPADGKPSGRDPRDSKATVSTKRDRSTTKRSDTKRPTNDESDTSPSRNLYKEMLGTDDDL